MPPGSDDPLPVSAVVQQYAQLLSLAAHELRTPATVVGGYLRMLQQDTAGPLTEKQRRMVDAAAASCGQLIELVSELSETGRLDGETAPVSRETFDLFAALGEVAGRTHEGSDREVRLQLTGPSDGATIRGDRTRLAAAFGALFRVVLREQPSATTVVGDRRLVRDAGVAWAHITIARQTDVQRASQAAELPFNERRGGVGLSLPIARRVIERQGGRVWSPAPESNDDKGLQSAIVVRLPLSE